jgi:hypothetical protein
MKKLTIAVIDIVDKRRKTQLFSRLVQANTASIMPQVVAAWCAQEGHDVRYACWVGYEALLGETPEKPDLVFICTFTRSAHHAYALSNLYRRRGAVTILGGPHARAYPEDAVHYFDYVVGFADRDLVRELLQGATAQRPLGLQVSASAQPSSLPGVQERWPYIEKVLEKQPLLKVVAMLGSLGCPYSCSFCVDSVVPYRQFDFREMQEDLRFLMQKLPRPIVAWHDPNYGVRYDQSLDAIEEVVPPGRVRFIAESSLALLNESRLQRLKRNGFAVLMPGIESWFEFGRKAKVGKATGMDKVEQVAEQVNLALQYVPYVQANFIFGLDSDAVDESFELTKRFVDLAPGAHPTISLITSYGGSAPQNLEYQRQGRIVSLPFHFLSGGPWTNVRPKNYEWPEIYRNLADLCGYAFSARAIARRFAAGGGLMPRVIDVFRALSTEGRGKIPELVKIQQQLHDPGIAAFMRAEHAVPPAAMIAEMRRDLGPLWHWLPEGACHHDAYAFLKSQMASSSSTGQIGELLGACAAGKSGAVQRTS